MNTKTHYVQILAITTAALAAQLAAYDKIEVHNATKGLIGVALVRTKNNHTEITDVAKETAYTEKKMGEPVNEPKKELIGGSTGRSFVIIPPGQVAKLTNFYPMPGTDRDVIFGSTNDIRKALSTNRVSDTSFSNVGSTKNHVFVWKGGVEGNPSLRRYEGYTSEDELASKARKKWNALRTPLRQQWESAGGQAQQ